MTPPFFINLIFQLPLCRRVFLPVSSNKTILTQTVVFLSTEHYFMRTLTFFLQRIKHCVLRILDAQCPSPPNPIYSCLDPTLGRVTKTIRLIHKPRKLFLYNYYLNVAEQTFETIKILSTTKNYYRCVKKYIQKNIIFNGYKMNVSLKSL